MQTIDTRMIFPIELSYLLILVATRNPSRAGDDLRDRRSSSSASNA